MMLTALNLDGANLDVERIFL